MHAISVTAACIARATVLGWGPTLNADIDRRLPTPASLYSAASLYVLFLALYLSRESMDVPFSYAERDAILSGSTIMLCLLSRALVLPVAQLHPSHNDSTPQ